MRIKGIKSIYFVYIHKLHASSYMNSFDIVSTLSKTAHDEMQYVLQSYLHILVYIYYVWIWSTIVKLTILVLLLCIRILVIFTLSFGPQLVLYIRIEKILIVFNWNGSSQYEKLLIMSLQHYYMWKFILWKWNSIALGLSSIVLIIIPYNRTYTHTFFPVALQLMWVMAFPRLGDLVIIVEWANLDEIFLRWEVINNGRWHYEFTTRNVSRQNFHLFFGYFWRTTKYSQENSSFSMAAFKPPYHTSCKAGMRYYHSAIWITHIILNIIIELWNSAKSQICLAKSSTLWY